MATVIRISHTNLGLYGYYDFSDKEVEPRIAVLPAGQHELQRSQVGDLRMYRTESDHYLFKVTINVGFYDTGIKMWELRELADQFVFYPWFRYDQASYFTVLWTNPDVLEEGYIHGMPEANTKIVCEFQEPRGVLCIPPS